MLHLVVCEKSGIEGHTAIEYLQMVRNMGLSVDITTENQAQIYPDRIFAPEYLSGRQYLEAIAAKSGVAAKERDELINRYSSECGFNKRQLKVPIRALGTGERKRIQLVQALIEHKKVCIFDYIFDAFDENTVGIALKVLAYLMEDSELIITAKDSTFAFDLGAKVWRIDGE